MTSPVRVADGDRPREGGADRPEVQVAVGVLVRPDRYVCAYLDGSAPNLAQLDSLLQSQGMASQSLKA